MRLIVDSIIEAALNYDIDSMFRLHSLWASVWCSTSFFFCFKQSGESVKLVNLFFISFPQLWIEPTTIASTLRYTPVSHCATMASIIAYSQQKINAEALHIQYLTIIAVYACTYKIYLRIVSSLTKQNVRIDISILYTW